MACPLGPKETGGETGLALLFYLTARCALQKLLSYTYTEVHGFMGLASGSVTSSNAWNRHVAFTTLYGKMKYFPTLQEMCFYPVEN